MGELGRLEVGDEADSRGPVVRETRGRRSAQEGVNRRGKRISLEDTTDAWARRAGRELLAYGERHNQWAGWARGQAGRGVGRAKNQEKMNFRIKIGFFEFIKALEICRWRFRRNFEMRIFPKFF
jgi:hypothetical protein